MTENDANTPVLRKHNAKINNCQVTISPSVKNLSSLNNLLFCVCGKQVLDINNPICGICAEKEEKSRKFGDLYRYSNKEKNFIKFWTALYKDSLYLYISYNSENHKAYYLLSSCFFEISQKNPIKLGSDFYYAFNIFTEKKTKVFACKSLEEFQGWTESIKNGIGFSCISDFYKITDTIGQIKGGVVTKGIHLKSNIEVAIKVYNKLQMEKDELENVYREIDIMRQCRHPNIIKLYDVFENRKNIYIVLEFLAGGDLFTYLENRKFSISEKRANHLIHYLGAALFYLH